MKKLITVLFLLISCLTFSQTPRPLISEFQRLKVDVGIIWSPGNPKIENKIMWSNDSKHIFFKEGFKYLKKNLEEVFFYEGSWTGMDVGVSTSCDADFMTDKEIETFKKYDYAYPHHIKTASGAKIGIGQDGRTIDYYFAVTKQNDKKKVLWIKEEINCLSLSPDEKFIAFLTRYNGLVVFYLDGYLGKTPDLTNEFKTLNKAINTLFQRQNGKKAKKIFSSLVDKDSKLSEAYIYRAYLTLNDDLDAALKYMRKAIDLEPHRTDYFLKIAETYQMNNNSSVAEEFFKKFVKARPTDAFGYLALIDFYIKAGNKKEAQINYELAKKYMTSRSFKFVSDIDPRQFVE